MIGTIRPASITDVPRMVALSERKRVGYARHQSVFWRAAADAAEKQAAYFDRLCERDDVVALVYEEDETIRGFIIGAIIAAPPIYDPGSLTCSVDDFAVGDVAEWQTTGRALLRAVRRAAAAKGAVQIVVVCGHHDEPLRVLLASCGCTIASEWWVDTIETESVPHVL